MEVGEGETGRRRDEETQRRDGEAERVVFGFRTHHAELGLGDPRVFPTHGGPGINAEAQGRRGWSSVPGPQRRLFTAVHSVPQSFLLITAVHAETVTGSTFAAASAL